MYKFTPPPPVTTVEGALSWMSEQLQAIERDQQETVAVDLRPVFVAPLRPRDGMVVFADGTAWDPGSGRGLYVFDTGAWVKI